MSKVLTTSGLVEALGRELAVAIEAIAGVSLTVAPATPPSGSGWGTPITATGALDGAITAWVDEAGVRALASRVIGSDDAVEASVAIDMLRELWTQAASATTLADGFAGLTLQVGLPSAGSLPSGATGLTILDGGQAMATLAMIGTVTAPAAATGGPSSREAKASPAASAPPGGALSEHLAALLDVDLPLVVRFARTEMALRSLAQLGPGSMVDMGRSPDAPVQLLVGAQVIAEGEVVVVSGNYGVRITSLISAADRLRALES